MNSILEQMLGNTNQHNVEQYENQLKEVVQQLSLAGLWRGKFFEQAGFYGGSALRIFHGLRRFSEDLDFSLLEPNETFSLEPFLDHIAFELEGAGFSFDVLKSQKQWKTPIDTAFVKGNTLINLLAITPPQAFLDQIPKSKILKVKLEVDTHPPSGASYEFEHLLTPFPFSVRLFSQSDLFAGKIHAILCRKWKNRIKGRDFYDFIWYVGQKVSCNLTHLEKRVAQSNPELITRPWNKKSVKELLAQKFNSIDFEQAKKDVLPFIGDPRELELWSTSFFLKVLEQFEASPN